MRSGYPFIICFLLLVGMYQDGFAQIKKQEESGGNISFCGTIDDPNSFKKDKYFGRNKELLDNLIKHKVKISPDYLSEIERKDEIRKTDPVMFSHESTPFLIPVRAWIYRNDDGSGNITRPQLNQIIQNLNNRFQAYANIRFYLLCNVTEINSTDFAESDDADYDDYIEDNRQAEALNVHFIRTTTTAWVGRATFPWDDTNFACAVRTEGVGDLDNLSNLLAHEIGHTLGLHHTHHPGRSNNDSKNENCGDCYQESVSRTRTQGLACISTVGEKKCEVNGDFLCDTNADPGLFWLTRTPPSYVDTACAYIGTGTDNWGSAWQPHVGNIMGYAPLDCIFYFSPLQVSKMYGYIDDIGATHPVFDISGPDFLCSGQTATYSVTPINGVTSYTWTAPYSMTIVSGQGTSSITVQGNYDYGGEITVTPDCGSVASHFHVQSLSSLAITGPEIACTNQTLYYETANFANTTYNWSITNGAITNGQGTNSIEVVLYTDPSNYSILTASIISPCNSSQIVSGNIYIEHYTENCQMLTENSGTEDSVSTDISARRGAELNKTESASDPNMKIFPNPAIDIVTIMMPDDKLYELSILSSDGKVVLRKSNVKYKAVINVKSFHSGIYIISVVDRSGKRHVNKLIVSE